MKTTTLTNGITVLAHDTGTYQGSAKTFVNRTQAVHAMRQLVATGINATIWTRGYPFYVAIEP